MEAQFLYGNPVMVDHTPTGAVALGEVITNVDHNGVAHRAIDASALGALASGGGVYLMAKEAPLVITKGDKVYWDATNNNIDKTNTNKPFGFCVEDAASAATTVKVLHWPF